MSSPQSNSTHTSDSPIALALRTARTPGRPLTELSIGNVTFCSTSSAARPGDSVSTTTVGAFSSGNTSTGMRGTWKPAKTSTPSASRSTASGCRSDHAISWRNMLLVVVRVEGAVGVEVAALAGRSRAREHQLVGAGEHDLVAVAHAALDLDPLAVVDAEVRFDADHLVGVGRIAAEE